MIYPNNFEQKIGFNEVRTLLKGKCLSTLGTGIVDSMTMSHNADEIQTWLTQTREFRLLQTKADDFPLQYFFDLRPTLSRLRIEGAHLDEQELFDLLRSLDTIHQVVRFLNRTSDGKVASEGQNARFPYPSLQQLTVDVETFPDIVRRITQIVDKFGKIKDSASPELARIRRELAQCDKPTFAAGGTVSYVSRTSHVFVEGAEQLEQGGTPPITQMVRAALAYGLRNEVGFSAICENERELGEYFERELDKIPQIINYCPRNLERLPIFSFNAQGVSPYDLAAILSNDYGVQTRAGCACAGPYGHDLLGLKDGALLSEKPGWVRVSLHYTHTFEDIDYLIEAIKKSIEKYRNLWAEERSFYEMMGKKNEKCVKSQVSGADADISQNYE